VSWDQRFFDPIEFASLLTVGITCAVREPPAVIPLTRLIALVVQI